MLYAKTEISDCLSVRYIETVHHINLTDANCGAEEHEFPELFYVEKGSHTVYVDDVPFSLSEGQLIIYAPHALHRGENGKKSSATVGIVSFEAEHCDLAVMCNRVITLTSEQREMLMKTVEMGAAMFEKTAPESGLAGMVLREGVTKHELQKLKHMLELFLIDVFGADELTPKAPITDNRSKYRREQFERAAAYMKDNITASLALDDIARESRVSVSKLAILFKEQCGTSPMAYFNDMKIEESQRLIRDTSMNFTEIAEAVGIGSIHYFSKLFKKKTGMTPSEYARSLGEYQ